MAEEKDFNDLLDDIFLSEDREHKESYEEGFKAGSQLGNPEGFHLGYHRGAELGRELGYYLGVITHHINLNQESDEKYSAKILTQLTRVKELIDVFPRINSEDHDILGMAETEFHSNYSESSMKSTITKVCHHIDSITKYLTPLLPIANCHMVEFLTLNHWEKLLPASLRDSLNGEDLNVSLNNYWSSFEQTNQEKTALSSWIQTAQSHCIKVNNEYCLSTEKLQEHIKAWGGDIAPEVKIKEFMTSKKSYEVQRMSRLVSSLGGASGASGVSGGRGAAGARCCVEAGGGRGALGAALSLAHGARCLSLDCDARAATEAAHRIHVIQKQWHTIAKRVNNGSEKSISEGINKNLHRFATAFITKDTDLSALVKETFPEYANDDVRILLTGLHTCGNLGPDSLRIFTTQPSVAALFNVPCCYHLLTETVDDSVFDVFQRDHGSGEESSQGFPMSDYLRGYNLGRNARMLAAQSIDRVVNQRQLPSKSLLYRALLQAIIKKHLPNQLVSEGKLKRITKKKRKLSTIFQNGGRYFEIRTF
ncbi:unnamed protein product [Arctia plantaginis]|uniref:Methyltransferase domain-containing protein n=1 Tax=Arctia plantaginis TaxID=874455 RepID=A0A8S0Z5Q8_ARCPL|nr:unnamed protein product [Arctia plantaginis]